VAADVDKLSSYERSSVTPRISSVERKVGVTVSRVDELDRRLSLEARERRGSVRNVAEAVEQLERSTRDRIQLEVRRREHSDLEVARQAQRGELLIASQTPAPAHHRHESVTDRQQALHRRPSKYYDYVPPDVSSDHRDRDTAQSVHGYRVGEFDDSSLTSSSKTHRFEERREDSVHRWLSKHGVEAEFNDTSRAIR